MVNIINYPSAIPCASESRIVHIGLGKVLTLLFKPSCEVKEADCCSYAKCNLCSV